MRSMVTTTTHNLGMNRAINECVYMVEKNTNAAVILNQYMITWPVCCYRPGFIYKDYTANSIPSGLPGLEDLRAR